MKNLRTLTIDLERAKHPAVPILQAVLECSNSPEFIEYVATAIADAARLDKQAEQDQLAQLSQFMGTK
jgi:hypothetical protein